MYWPSLPEAPTMQTFIDRVYRPYAFAIQVPNRSLNRPTAKARRIVPRFNHQFTERRKVLA